MEENHKEIHPEKYLFLTRSDKEKLIGQKSKALWLTGLSGAGKTTIAVGLEKKLQENGFISKVFDGDIVRSYIHKNLDFSLEGRRNNIEKIAELNKEFIECGIIVINSFISPGIEMRERAREIIGKDDFIEIYLNCPLSICENRDIKGLYKKARKGEIKHFTGVDSPYEAPLNPHVEIDTSKCSKDVAVDRIFGFILPLIKLNG
ncbi:MAG: adenylyl-sulfate kinase [Bacteroidales bacterium]|nr:adenylyl-sulfate kinase [Bacteroidales bacterium]